MFLADDAFHHTSRDRAQPMTIRQTAGPCSQSVDSPTFQNMGSNSGINVQQRTFNEEVRRAQIITRATAPDPELNFDICKSELVAAVDHSARKGVA